MIRKATIADTAAVADTYTALLLHEQTHGSHSNWKLGVYPTAQYAEETAAAGMLFVLEENSEICASMVLNHNQADEYAGIAWKFPAEPEQVLVIHTLCIPPERAGHGYATQMMRFAAQYARAQNWTVIRLDTYEHNEPAKRLYLKNGFHLAGSADALLHGVISEQLVYLECDMTQEA